MSQRILDRTWPWVLASIVVAALFVASFVSIDWGGAAPPRAMGSADDIEALASRDDVNVLFVLIDTLRADRLATYGYERDTSPVLDKMASEGVRFSRHLAQSSWTKCSMASLWTGLNPARTGVTRFDDIVPDEAIMPAEILRDAGFRTVGLYRNGWVAPTFGFDQGFDVYTRPSGSTTAPSVRIENPTLTLRGTDIDVVDTGLEFLRIHGEDRWFLYLHLMDIHEYVYDEATALYGGTYSDVYDNSVRWTDQVIGHLLDQIDAAGYGENTLVVIAADHGEAFQERGFEGHARVVFRESTEIPFYIRFPFRLDSGVVLESRTRNVDVWPTLLDLLGLDIPTGIDGISRRDEIVASARGVRPEATDEMAISHLDQNWGQRQRDPAPTIAVADGDLRYVRVRQFDTSIEQLFDAGSDAPELEDIAATNDAEVARLRAIADAYLEQEPAFGTAPTREINELELNQLRALGYAIP